MKLLLEEKPLKGTWWKWGLALMVAQNIFWCLLAWKVLPTFNIVDIYAKGWFVWIGWIIFSWLAIIAGRLGLKTLMWSGLIGFVIGDLAYGVSILYEPLRLLSATSGYTLLAFTAFIQANLTFLSLGILIEFGRYVYRRVFEE